MGNKMVEIWGDVINISHLIMSIIISSISTMGAYSLASSNSKTKELLFGLLGAVLGFIISTILYKPKRTLTE